MNALERLVHCPVQSKHLGERECAEPIVHVVEDLPRYGNDGNSGFRRQLDDTADHLAFERLIVDKALAREHKVDTLHRGGEIDRFCDDIESVDKCRAECRQTTGQTTGSARPRERKHIDAELLEIVTGEPFESPTKKLHLYLRRTFLRREHGGRVNKSGADVAGDQHVNSDEPHG